MSSVLHTPVHKQQKVMVIDLAEFRKMERKIKLLERELTTAKILLKEAREQGELF